MSDTAGKKLPLPVCWVNGRISGPQNAVVSVFDHGFLYGDGVFEGMRFYQGQVFLLQEHLQRLADSAQAIALALPLTLNAIARLVQDLVQQCEEQDGYIRLIVTRGVGPLGLNPASCGEPGLMILLDHLKLVSQEVRNQGLRVIVSATRRPQPDVLNPRIKSLNYLNNILARLEATVAGADEAVMLNQQGMVAEGSAENIFIARDGILTTPPVTDGALAGITRATLIQLARDAGLNVQEASLTVYDLYCADEVFLTGSGAELLPVAQVDGRIIKQCPGPLYLELDRVFQRFVRQHSGRDLA